MNVTKSIGEVSRSTGLSEDTLRYYERAGIVHGVARDGGGRRRYSETALEWLELVKRLRSTGMPIATLQRYARLAGERGTGKARRQLLVDHAACVEREISRLTEIAALLRRKVEMYDEALASRGRERARQ